MKEIFKSPRSSRRLLEWEKKLQVEKSLLKILYDSISNESSVPGEDSVRISAAISSIFIQLIRSLPTKGKVRVFYHHLS